MTVAVPATETLYIDGATPLSQDNDLGNTTTWNQQSIEDSLDRVTRQQQELRRDIVNPLVNQLLNGTFGEVSVVNGNFTVGADVPQAKNFTPSAPGVVRTIQSKLRDTVSVRDLIAVNGSNDDGLALTNALIARFGDFTAGGAIRTAPVEVHFYDGDNLVTRTPVKIPNKFIRLISHGATINGQNIATRGIQILTDPGAAPDTSDNVRVTGFRIRNATQWAIDADAIYFGLIEDNETQFNGNGIRFNGISTRVRNNDVRFNTGTGILEDSFTTAWGAGTINFESYSNDIEGNRCWLNGGWGMIFKGGVGNRATANDVEANTLGNIWNQSSQSLTFLNNYAESTPGVVNVLQDNTVVAAPARTAGDVKHSNWVIGGGFSYDFDIRAGNHPLIAHNTLGTGNIRLSADSTVGEPRIMDNNGAALNITTPNNSGFINHIGKMRGVKSISGTAVEGNNLGGFFDVNNAALTLDASVTPNRYTMTVTLPGSEPDAAWQPIVSGMPNLAGGLATNIAPAHLAGAWAGFPTSGATPSFTVSFPALPGTGVTLRYHYLVKR